MDVVGVWQRRSRSNQHRAAARPPCSSCDGGTLEVDRDQGFRSQSWYPFGGLGTSYRSTQLWGIHKNENAEPRHDVGLRSALGVWRRRKWWWGFPGGLQQRLLDTESDSVLRQSN